MGNQSDDPLDNVAAEVERRIEKSDKMRETKRTKKVEFTGPEGQGEAEATVEVCNDGQRHFVDIFVDIPFKPGEKVVSVNDDSLGGALSKAEGEFAEKEYGNISLEWLGEEE